MRMQNRISGTGIEYAMSRVVGRENSWESFEDNALRCGAILSIRDFLRSRFEDFCPPSPCYCSLVEVPCSCARARKKKS